MCLETIEIPVGQRTYHVSLDWHNVILIVSRHLDFKSESYSDTTHKCLLCSLLFQPSDYAYLPCIRAARALAFARKLIPHIATKLQPLYGINTRRTSTLLPCAV